MSSIATVSSGTTTDACKNIFQHMVTLNHLEHICEAVEFRFGLSLWIRRPSANKYIGHFWI